MEAGEDWDSLREDLSIAIQDAKVQLESQAFVRGTGEANKQPQGILTGVGSSLSHGAIAAADLSALQAALPGRRPERRRVVRLAPVAAGRLAAGRKAATPPKRS